MDYGVKENIIRSMERRGCRVIRFPHDTPADTVLGSGADGVLLSNGPGDPSVLEREAAEAAKLLGKLPLLGVCLGNQLLAMACGGKTKKLSFGHRGANQPVLDLATGRGLLTSQNHQYAVDAASLAGTEARGRIQASRRRLGRGAAPQAVRRAVGAVPSRGFAGAGGRLLYFRQFHRPYEGRAQGEIRMRDATIRKVLVLGSGR